MSALPTAPSLRAWWLWPRDIWPPRGYEFSEKSLIAYVQAFQQSTALKMIELWALVPALKLVLLEEIAARGSKVTADPEGSYGVGVCVRSLRDISQTAWKEVLEPLILFDRILRQDPAGAYPRMDFESRDLYRTELAEDCGILRSDRRWKLPPKRRPGAGRRKQETHSSPRLEARLGHVGYYLLGGRIRRSARSGGLSASAGAADCIFPAAASERVLSARDRSAHAGDHVGDRAAADQHLHLS